MLINMSREYLVSARIRCNFYEDLVTKDEKKLKNREEKKYEFG